MRDVDIRLALRREMQVLHASDPETRVLEELSLCLGIARVDVAVVNGSIHGFEIKSEHDTLARLRGQAAVYGRALDRVTLVVAEPHLTRAMDHIPTWWGIVVAAGARAGTCQLTLARAASDNPDPDALAIAQLLWRDEALALLERAGLAAGMRSKSRRALWSRLADQYPLGDLRSAVRDAIRHRPEGWLAGGSPA